MLLLLLNDRIKKRKRPRLFHFLRLPSLRLLLLLVNNWKRLCVYERSFVRSFVCTRKGQSIHARRWPTLLYCGMTSIESPEPTVRGMGAWINEPELQFLRGFFLNCQEVRVYTFTLYSLLSFFQENPHTNKPPPCVGVCECALCWLVLFRPRNPINSSAHTHSHTQNIVPFFFFKRERRSRRRGKALFGCVCVCVCVCV